MKALLEDVRYLTIDQLVELIYVLGYKKIYYEGEIDIGYHFGIGSYTEDELKVQNELINEINVTLIKNLTKDNVDDLELNHKLGEYLINKIKTEINAIQLHKLEWALSVHFE